MLGERNTCSCSGWRLVEAFQTDLIWRYNLIEIVEEQFGPENTEFEIISSYDQEVEDKDGADTTCYKNWQDGFHYSCYINHRGKGKLNFVSWQEWKRKKFFLR